MEYEGSTKQEQDQKADLHEGHFHVLGFRKIKKISILTDKTNSSMKHHAPRFLKLVNDTRQHVRETTVEAIYQRLASGERLTLIDVREDHEWNESRIPGSLHLSKGIAERDIESRFPDTGEELILYCGGGFRSVLTAWTLGQMGYTAVISMDGGFRGWKEAGYPLDTQPPAGKDSK